jgi:hypothetical protein
MADDLAAQLQQLQNLRGLLGEEIYAQGLAKLRAQYGAAAVDALLDGSQLFAVARGHTQIVSGRADVAVAGHVHGNIYIAGQRTRSNTQLLASYLVRLTRRCGRLPLQGVYEQRAASDSLDIDLNRVYTQLATTASAGNEIDANLEGDLLF